MPGDTLSSPIAVDEDYGHDVTMQSPTQNLDPSNQSLVPQPVANVQVSSVRAGKARQVDESAWQEVHLALNSVTAPSDDPIADPDYIPTPPLIRARKRHRRSRSPSPYMSRTRPRVRSPSPHPHPIASSSRGVTRPRKLINIFRQTISPQQNKKATTSTEADEEAELRQVIAISLAEAELAREFEEETNREAGRREEVDRHDRMRRQQARNELFTRRQYSRRLAREETPPPPYQP